jgi:cell division protease FtsH
MKTTQIPLRSHISERSAQLRNIVAELKTELFGIDDVIDRVMDTIRAWYVLPEIINRPVIVNLWGLTGTGKTQLIRSLSKKLGFYDRLIEVQMDGYSNGGGTSIGSMLSDSAVTEGTPGILVLDEFQRIRTIDRDGRERKVEYYMDVWDLLSDGKLPPNISFLGDMERRLAEAAYREERKRQGANLDADEDDVVVERLFARQPHNNHSKFALTPYQAQDFKGTLKLRESTMEIMTWSPQDLHGRLMSFTQDPHVWEADYSKLLIFVWGNLDEMYGRAGLRRLVQPRGRLRTRLASQTAGNRTNHRPWHLRAPGGFRNGARVCAIEGR